MPRNSLTNGKLAPDSFNTQLDECAYPLVMALAVRAHEPHLLHATTSARRRTSSPPTGPSFGPERWEEQGGFSPSTIAAEIAGLLAAARIARPQRRPRPRRRLARRRRRVPAQPQGLDAHDQRPAQRATVLHPALEDRRPERRDRLQRRQRRPDARPARGDRRRLPRVRAARRCCAERRPGPRPLARPSSTRDPAHHRLRRRASTATTATATATARPTGGRGRPPARATATCGRCWRASAASGSSTRATSGAAVERARGDARTWPPASG